MPNTFFAAQAGVATRQQLLAAGLSRHALAWQVSSGRWQRPLTGVFAGQSGALSQLQWVWAALLWAGAGAALCGPTAAARDGLRGYEVEAIHLAIPNTRHLDAPKGAARKLVITRSARLGEEDVHPLATPRRTRLPRSIIDTAALRPRPEDAFAVIAAGVQQRLVTPELLAAAIDSSGRLRHRGILRAGVLDLLGGAHSLPERDFLRIVRVAGLPMPDLQSVRTHAGKRRYLDVYWKRYRLAAEIDGMGHLSVGRWIDDMARSNEVVVDGDAVLRFPAILIRTRPDVVEDVLVRAFLTRGWQAAA